MAKRKILKITKIIIIIVIFTVPSLVIYNKENNKALQYIDTVDIKIGDYLPTIDKYIDNKTINYLKDKNIVWNNIKLEDNKVYSAAKYTGYITYKDKKIELNLNVIDDIAPSITEVKDIAIYKNQEIDLLKNVKVVDNSHDDITLTIEGEYETKNAGEYDLKVKAVDKSGNITSEGFKLTVKDIETNTSNNTIKEDIIVGTTLNGYTIKRINGIYYINDILIANKSYNLPNTYDPKGLMPEFTIAFNNMKNDAKLEDVT